MTIEITWRILLLQKFTKKEFATFNNRRNSTSSPSGNSKSENYIICDCDWKYCDWI